MLKSMRKNGLTLALFALGCTAMVVLTNELTRDRIAHQQQLEQLRTLGALLPEGSYDNDLVASCKLVRSREYLGSDQPMPLYTATLKGVHTGYALETVAPDGYSGAIRMVVGTDAKGAISAVRVLTHKETPGLGDKIELKKSNWIDSFVGRTLNAENEASWAVKKDGGEFDAFTGATITPRAVVKAVKNLLLLQQEHPELLRDAPSCDATP
ncbi:MULTISPECIES: electron transport complex subunit RsxG [Aeromonas]|uniref:Ion-translocating oxidoreductase complex subunit G n=1 Tax=Aeromonas sanarellii TaxID=633415 RepID=A0ABS4B0M1_9GAMM|nr:MULTISPECIES: electron transport complex subunit RsxG [Aeromonas]MBP0601019.1 electron transport complex subunit RsxG [Aeromonas sanarellii]MDH0475719.1 electron transport complex subunit RsxG [Aeromonas caviae]MDX7753315.1 electron transport complex subunit RsxG [Aeromonas caviae]MDX7774064.1 electron transport complex subunit RsxG [Aeromonas caviae]POV91589.1 electron transport complex subunit RsxG [Aeromonas sp. ASNIH8]